MALELKSLEHDHVQSLLSVKSFVSRHVDGGRMAAELAHVQGRSESEDAAVTEWLRWCQSRPGVLTVEAAVPATILSGATLVDIKVGGRRREPDDKIYNRNPDIRRRVARGNCVLELRGPGATHRLCLVHALKKFTGGMGDEDDETDDGDDANWRRFFLQPLETASRLVLTQKANGEAAHLSARWLDGAFLLCVGSKNVHMVLRREVDIELYSEPRYQVARQVAAALWRHLAALDDEQRRHLLSFLHHTRFTAVFELLQPDHQHVEDLSHLEHAELRFITWTLSFDPSSEPATSLCSCPPELAFRLAESFGLKTVRYSVVTDNIEEELPDIMLRVRKAHGFEGKVIFFVDDDGNVIGMLKKKTAWYILLRALREKLCFALGKFPFAEFRSLVEKRFRAIQAWLGLDDAFVENWIELGMAFAKWCKDHDYDTETLRTMLPPLWSQFLRKSGRTDHFEAHIS
ncbi:uncharacterized protein LOC119091407 [Pollicipes pollicipes]|uniref:uncharacterized protein LOC119091407 n=1 Tax=Pollicipes pollicipes TaxID=41117 RepID=UPI001885807E|nr:uncharacterized protein LOC119091407 [Pollicipes pollicipes]